MITLYCEWCQSPQEVNLNRGVRSMAVVCKGSCKRRTHHYQAENFPGLNKEEGSQIGTEENLAEVDSSGGSLIAGADTEPGTGSPEDQFPTDDPS